ncbi:MAG: 30S ribosomal protein S4e [Nitrososphaerota archaeon]
MGRHGASSHLKREAAPRFWPIHKKEFTWTTKPSPGPHALKESIPLVIALREILGFAKTRKEAKRIISQGKIFVDGRVRLDEHFGVGLMDVISILETKQNYRLMPIEKGLFMHPISEDEAKFKICRIENKSTLKSGNIQLNLHDGKNVMIRAESSPNPPGDIYGVFDSLVIGLPGQELLEHLKLKEGMLSLFVAGKNAGKYGAITSIEEQTGQKRRKALVTIEDQAGNTFQTTLDCVFVIGDKTPRISLPNLGGQ